MWKRSLVTAAVMSGSITTLINIGVSSKVFAANVCSSAQNLKASSRAQHTKTVLSESQLRAAWEISRDGVSELVNDTYGLENAIYHSLTALMSKENILLDGPGGGAKTMSIKNSFEAQLRAVRGIADRTEISAFKRELLEVLWADKMQVDPSKRIFTQQFHATLSETKILGGPDPFKFTEQGKYEIDYSKALISDKNMFAILDELEKAPVALQMTLLSILNERQALVGNKVVQTALESVSATTNATLSELIAQALPHEIGGREAMIDRFGIKVHIVNVPENADSLFFMLEKINATAGQKRFTIIDIRSLRSLLDRVQTSKEVFDAMSEISLHMDRFYASNLTKAYSELANPKDSPRNVPSFSGSTRTQGKVPNLWKSAFLVRQLMSGKPYSSLDLEMGPKDLVDLAPSVLQGGPDVLVAKQGVKINFFQSLQNAPFVMLGSNEKTKRRVKFNISTGVFDPNTGLFKYRSAKTSEMRYVYFDAKTGKLSTQDPQVLEELSFQVGDLFSYSSNPFIERYGNLEKTLAMVYQGRLKSAKKSPDLQYATTGRLDAYIDGGNSPLRRSSKAQLVEIRSAHEDYLSALNAKISHLKNQPKTPMSDADLVEVEKVANELAQQHRNSLKVAIQSNNKQAIEDAAAAALRNAVGELNYRFIEASSNVKALMLTVFNRKNISIFGPKGSGKTLLVRTVLGAEVEFLSEAQIAKANSVLSEALLASPHGEHSLWVKQFHPMSTEGDVVGRIDLKQVRDGNGYAYNRTGSLSSKDVLFALLDEFEKAPAGVKTALLSLLNERKLMDGDEVYDSNLIAVAINTNATPGQFLTGLGDFSTAFPIYDRIHQKAYSFNKLTVAGLKEFHRRMHYKFSMALKSPLFVHPLTNLAKIYKLESQERKLLAQIHQAFMVAAVNKSEIEREMFESDVDGYRDFFMQTRGESYRSAISEILQEFPGAATLNRLLSGKKPSQMRAEGMPFDLIDLVAFSELLTTFNGLYSIAHDYDPNGMIYFKVVEKDLSSIMDRIDPTEKKTIENMKFEFVEVAKLLNQFTKSFVETQDNLILKNRELYPSLFASESARAAWEKNHP